MAEYSGKAIRRLRLLGVLFAIGSTVTCSEEVMEELVEKGAIDKDSIEEVGDDLTGSTSEFDKITVAQIKEQLTAKGVEFDDRAKKDVLFALLTSDEE